MRIEKEKEGYHVVLTTHNSRTSDRMKRLKVKKGRPIHLSLDQEILLSQIIGRIILENNFKCLAYNICKDHVHLLIVCEYDELARIIRRIKSQSARKYNILIGNTEKKSPDVCTMGQAPLERIAPKKDYKHLWSKKFFRVDLDVWKPASLSYKPGYLYKQTHLEKVLVYIENNRYKHYLPSSIRLRSIIKSFVTSQDIAFRVEWKESE